MKTYPIILLIFLNNILVFSQDFKLTIGQKQKVSRQMNIVDVGEIDEKIYIVKEHDKFGLQMSIATLNSNTLKQENSTMFKSTRCKDNQPHCLDKHFEYRKTLFLKDNIVIFVDTYERKKDERRLYAQRMNKSGKFVGNLKLMDKFNADKSDEGSFLIWPSADSSKFVVIQNPKFEKDKKEKFNFKIYDTELNNQSNTGIVLPYKDDNASVIDYYLTNDGQIIMLVSVQLEKDKIIKGEDDDYYEILFFSPEEEKLSKYKIKLDDKNIEDIAIRIDNKNNQIICSGFYSNIVTKAHRTKDIDGFYYLRVDIKDREIIGKGFKELGDKIIEQITQRKRKRKNEKRDGISDDFEIGDLIQKEDGSMVIVSERYWTETVTTSSCNNGRCTYSTHYHYYAYNIFVAMIDKEGEIKTFIDIPKKQFTVDDGGRYISYFSFEKEDRLFLFYNDHPENLKPGIKSIDDVKRMYNIKKASLVAVEIKPDGTYTKKELFNNKDYKMTIIPVDAFKIDDGEYIVPIQAVKPGCGCFSYFSKPKIGLLKIEL